MKSIENPDSNQANDSSQDNDLSIPDMNLFVDSASEEARRDSEAAIDLLGQFHQHFLSHLALPNEGVRVEYGGLRFEGVAGVERLVTGLSDAGKKAIEALKISKPELFKHRNPAVRERFLRKSQFYVDQAKALLEYNPEDLQSN